MHTTRTAMFGLAALLIAATVWGAGAPVSYPCYRNAAAPTLDGTIAGDPGWANIPGVTGYHRLGGDYTVAKQTTAHATWDAANLYVAIAAEEPDIALIKPTTGDGGDCWLDDGVEVFIHPEGKGPFQFVVTTRAARCSGEGNAPLSGWEAKAAATPAGYVIELRISFAVMGATPTAGSVWHANYCRNTFTVISGGDKFTTWAPLESRFLEPEHFPLLRFEAGAASEPACRQAEERLNAGYRTALLTGLSQLVAESGEYTPFLAEMAKNPKYRREAVPLRSEWRRAQNLLKGAAQAPLSEVREVLKQSEKLREDSRHFKYDTLIKELFEE